MKKMFTTAWGYIFRYLVCKTETQNRKPHLKKNEIKTIIFIIHPHDTLQDYAVEDKWTNAYLNRFPIWFQPIIFDICDLNDLFPKTKISGAILWINVEYFYC